MPLESKLLWWPLAAAACWVPSLSAQELPGEQVETIVVTASRLAQPAAQLAQAVEVIERAEIDALQPATVAELLRHLTGVNVIQQGARGSVTSLVLRGGEPNFTVVLIDGVKVNDSTNTRGGSYDFSFLDLASIERVEVVRGPMSALYGSDALSGVVNIITALGDERRQLRAETGGHGLVSTDLVMGGKLGYVEARLVAHALEEDGDIEGASFKDRGVAGSLSLPFGSSNKAGVSWRYQDADSTSFPEDSGGPELAVLRDTDVRDVNEAHIRVFTSWTTSNLWSLDVSVSRYRRDDESRSPGIAPGVFDGVPPVYADSRFERDQATISFGGQLSDATSLVVGGEWQREDGLSDGTIDFGVLIPARFEIERKTRSAFSEIQWQGETVRLQGSIRWDDPDGIASETSAQLGVLFDLPAGNLRLTWGEGFKAPSFAALAHPLVGNPDLESETATSLDAGFRFAAGETINAEISVFRNEYANLIDFDPVLFTNVNRSKVVSEGAEFSFSWVPDENLQVDGHLTYLDTDIRSSDANLRGRPHWRGGVQGRWQLTDQWQLSAGLLGLDEFYDASIPTGSIVLDGYSRLDLSARYTVNDHWRIGLAVDNALDADYAEAVGFPAAGIRARINVTYSFQP